MSVSEVAICNMALGALGVTQQISALDEDSTEAANCTLYYEHVRDYVLRAMPWDFAKKYASAQLVEEADSQAWSYEWSYSYRYPSDCLFLRRIEDGGGGLTTPPPPFSLGYDSSGKLVFTNVDDAIFVYTSKITDTTLFDPMFVDALCMRLAWSLAMPLAITNGLDQIALQKYEVAIGRASAASGNESSIGEEPDFGPISARL